MQLGLLSKRCHVICISTIVCHVYVYFRRQKFSVLSRFKASVSGACDMGLRRRCDITAINDNSCATTGCMFDVGPYTMWFRECRTEQNSKLRNSPMHYITVQSVKWAYAMTVAAMKT